MDLIQVDPKLFITCRLCVEEMGQYQIVPSVQQKIKYCFDIDVESFDGLPQLICDKCNKILTNVAQWKQSFTEKQLNLKTRTKKPDKLNSIQEVCSEPEQKTASTILTIQPQKSTVSCTQISKDVADINIHKPKKRKNSDSGLKWTGNYKRQIMCKLCNTCWGSTISLMDHIRDHDIIRSEYSFVFKTNNFVKLNKIDHKPNLTGQSSAVVYNPDRVVIAGNSYFYTLYVKDSSNCKTDNIYITGNSIVNSSDDEIKVKKNKKRRHSSKSSNETVLVETKTSKPMSDTEHNTKSSMVQGNDDSLTLCTHPKGVDDQSIRIDDSSDSETEIRNIRSDDTKKEQVQLTFTNRKVIKSIILMCVKSYEKRKLVSKTAKMKKNNSTTDTESQLSLGKKVITNQGFNFTGLLNYMERKNLNIIWKRPHPHSLIPSNFIRIFTKVLVRFDQELDNKYKWIEVPAAPESSGIIKGNLPVNDPGIESPIVYVQKYDAAKVNDNSEDESGNKILSPNPLFNSEPPKITCDKNNDESFVGTPVEKSNVISEKPDNGTNDISQADKSNIPAGTDAVEPLRIKLKPVAELMSDKPLCSFVTNQSSSSMVSAPMTELPNKDIEEILQPPQNSVTYVQYMSPSVSSVSSSSVPSVQCPYSNVVTHNFNANVIARRQDCVMLNTVELSYKRMHTPYTYLKDLLRLHNILLIDTVHPNIKYVYLIKFQAKLSQATINQAVVLSLSLLGSVCSRNLFCFQVKDLQNNTIDINKLSANWQWEILELYRSNSVISKALSNAKNVDQILGNFTYKLLSTLKSIKKIS